MKKEIFISCSSRGDFWQPLIALETQSVWGSTYMYSTNLKRLVLLQKRAVRIISKSCYDTHTKPIFKSYRILQLNDMYLAEIGKIMFQYKTGSLRDVFKGSSSRLCAYARDDVNLLFKSQSQTRSELKRECECLAVSQLAVRCSFCKICWGKRLLNQFSS